MNYSEKLRDPRWQKKRLEILQRDGFTCTLCGDKQTTLHIHHSKYFGDPWDIKDEFLTTHCQHCHSIIEFYKKSNIQVVGIKKYYDTEDNVSLIVAVDSERYLSLIRIYDTEVRVFSKIPDESFLYDILQFYKSNV